MIISTIISTTLYNSSEEGSSAVSILAKTASTTPIVISPSDPVRLEIPSLQINSHIQRVTVSGHDTIGVPTNFSDVGWYVYSPKPGQNGYSIIDGHVDNGLALAGVFKYLYKTNLGDSVYVTTQGNVRLHFKVTQIQTYSYDSTSTDALSFSATGSYLRLITCTGQWLSMHRTYDKRLLVTAKLIQ